MIKLISTTVALCLFSALAVAAPAAAEPRTTLARHDAGGERRDTYLRFVLHSTKAGLIKSRVEGYVRDFDVSYEWDGATARHATVGFATRALRTDNGSRDDKMWNTCLDADHHPRVEVKLDADVPVGREVQVPGQISIRGAWHPVQLSAKLTREHGTLVLAGVAKVKLSELQIPDPSIWIAKVDDTIELAFRVVGEAPAAPAGTASQR
ncbi:MAG: YceI family protein [Archangiaceae bacterium]|nr:YceI family protein [Archangiaceae bacterium]